MQDMHYVWDEAFHCISFEQHKLESSPVVFECWDFNSKEQKPLFIGSSTLQNKNLEHQKLHIISNENEYIGDLVITIQF